ncbi:MAG: alpha/beta hydrolase fold domain-containing protein [Myxococcales bacterium]|nr:alpha/beta hydrolase fold domain-containing protein [Myxococcales bacterium]
MPSIPRSLRARGQKTLGRAIVGALDTVPKLTRNLPHARRRREGLSIWEDVPYRAGGEAAHRLDVFRLEDAPEGQRALLYVHGGGFSSCSKATHISLAVAFARRGFTVFNMDYRLAPRHRYPAALDDVVDALVFVRQHAASYGADGSAITLAGESAGANLIVSTALLSGYDVPLEATQRLREGAPDITAVLAGCGVFQVSDMGRFWRTDTPPSRLAHGVARSMEAAYLGAPDQTPGAHVLADPVVLLEQQAPTRPLPPHFVFCGTGDFLVHDSQRLAAALEGHGVPTQLRTYAGEPHAFHALQKRPAAVACWRDHEAFIEAHVGPVR